MMAVPAHPFQRNRLLAALPLNAYERLLPHLRSVPLPYRATLFREDDALTEIYFPLSGMVSLVVTTDDGSALEVGITGREGMVPLLAALGAERADHQGLVQAQGEAVRVPTAILREQGREPGPLRDLLERYTSAALQLMRQSAVCNRLHPVEERLARWLLQAQDRVEAERMPLTQEFLGLMLGVRRASVTTAVAILQQAGLIQSQYGHIRVLDRSGLELASCQCYARMRDMSEQVFIEPGPAPATESRVPNRDQAVESVHGLTREERLSRVRDGTAAPSPGEPSRTDVGTRGDG